jgi:AcrR family transcriptional regulator
VPAPTRERILDAAWRLFLRQGFAGTTVTQIEAAASLAAGSGSFYRHFRSKEELLLAAAESLADEVAATFRESVGDQEVGVQEAGPLLAGFLEPRLPVFLELLARSIQRRHGYPEAARRIFGRLASQVGQVVTGPGSADARGTAVVAAASTAIVAQTLAQPIAEAAEATRPASLRAVLATS